MSDDLPTTLGLSIRLVPDSSHTGCWSVAVRNDGPSTFTGVLLDIAEGGIPCPGDLGSTLIRTYPLEKLGPTNEVRIGSFSFVPGGEYLDRPLVASLTVNGRVLLTLVVTTDDLDRLARPRAKGNLSKASSQDGGWWPGSAR